MATRDDQASVKASDAGASAWSAAGPSRAAARETDVEPVLRQKQGVDHAITLRHQLSSRRYPRDCPPLRVQWFHAVDVAKRRPNQAGGIKKDEKSAVTPKKYAAFSKKDSKAIEAAFQEMVDEEESVDRHTLVQRRVGPARDDTVNPRSDAKPNKSLGEDSEAAGRIKVPVNEDYLFDVDVERRELGPAYWMGPVYDVRRGSWFYQDGTVQRPCDENLASQLEDGYLKKKAWALPSHQTTARSASQASSRPTSWAPGQAADVMSKSPTSSRLSSSGSHSDLRAEASMSDAAKLTGPSDSSSESTYRLFGSHMNSVVTYQDATTAWLSTDDFVSRMNYSMYQRFAGGGHFAGVKMTRGYIDTAKKAGSKDAKTNESKQPITGDKKDPNASTPANDQGSEHPQSPNETRRQNLERQMSFLLEDSQSRDPAKQDEDQRRRDEREIEDDYRETDGEDQGREVEHLILVTHGIGQRLGLRIESVNFVHDVNTMRKTLKAVYADSPDLRALNAELDSTAKTNSRVQVLPICWRHLLDFPKQAVNRNRAEHDLADPGFGDEEKYPSLSDISVEGVPAVRNLISDLALDILLYQSPAYKDHISRIVLDECNRIYHLFVRRNPTFKGKVSMLGHSLGSAIMFDLLCEQEQNNTGVYGRPAKDRRPMKLDFDVADFYAIGSPIGLFQMLHGRKLAARDESEGKKSSLGTMDDPMLDASATKTKRPLPTLGAMPPPTSDIQLSQPKCEQIFNIFHPTDPIAYRIEPLISHAMATLKPQPLPYTKRGIFGAPIGQGLTGIGNRVGQSVSSMWSSMSSGLASSLLTRGLGYTGEDAVTMAGAKTSAPLSLGAGTNITGGGVVPQVAKSAPAQAAADVGSRVAVNKQAQLASDALAAGARGQHPPTLIDQELETLSSGYEKRRQSLSSDSQTRDFGTHSDELVELEARGERLRREEEKVRKLNGNGRVDYAIQEGAFDINLLAAVASHLSYWGDEDVSHFMISQLLSRWRVGKPASRDARTKSAHGKRDR